MKRFWVMKIKVVAIAAIVVAAMWKARRHDCDVNER
jgi:hypothetical protein